MAQHHNQHDQLEVSHPMRNLILAAVLCLSTAIPVGAQAEDAARSPAPAGPPAHLIGGNAPLLVGGVSDSPYALFGVGLDGGIVVGAGVRFGYDGTANSDKASFGALFHGAYMLKNTPNFAVGPELAIEMPFAPSPASTVKFTPGIALWYAPFSVPILFGTAIALDIVYVKNGGNVVVELRTPGLRIGFAF
jgi:hypothetical protein